MSKFMRKFFCLNEKNNDNQSLSLHNSVIMKDLMPLFDESKPISVKKYRYRCPLCENIFIKRLSKKKAKKHPELKISIRTPDGIKCGYCRITDALGIFKT
ncbi:hypothetical protein [Megavirus chiliensis]|uniref:Uncharacterized protein n=1 Tax=Megavirus chiliensis TaxID=1094892 RepID=G5CR72_9VIRU|nr:hypothetical protein MegaChil _gp0135 [Megavirus chiliensis]AEQ33494.1 hypothetical protein [Megavirus chiliensis]